LCLGDVCLCREERRVIGVAGKLLEVGDFDIELHLLEVFSCKFLLGHFLWQLNFRRLFMNFFLHLRSFFVIFLRIFLLLFHFLLLLHFGLFLPHLFDLHILVSIDVGKGNVLCNVGIVDGKHGDGICIGDEDLEFGERGKVVDEFSEI
jgi:hypothetical protein